jgi:hypothetical protein
VELEQVTAEHRAEMLSGMDDLIQARTTDRWQRRGNGYTGSRVKR